MPAEIGLDGLRGLPRLQGEGGLGEFGHHLRLGEIAEVSTVILGTVEAELLGQVLKLLAVGKTGHDVFGLLLGADQDMARADPLRLLELGGLFFIDLADFLFRHLRADRLEEISVTKGLGLVERQAALVFLGVRNAFLHRQLRQEVPLDQIFDDERIAHDVVGGHLDLRDADLVAIDDGNHLVFLRRVFLCRSRQDQRQAHNG